MTSDAMTYSRAMGCLTGDFGLPDLTARNVLQTAFKGQSAWFGGSQSPHRFVHDRGASRADGYRLLADGYVIRENGPMTTTTHPVTPVTPGVETLSPAGTPPLLAAEDPETELPCLDCGAKPGKSCHWYCPRYAEPGE